jgi:hypothetical protein
MSPLHSGEMSPLGSSPNCPIEQSIGLFIELTKKDPRYRAGREILFP